MRYVCINGHEEYYFPRYRDPIEESRVCVKCGHTSEPAPVKSEGFYIGSPPTVFKGAEIIWDDDPRRSDLKTVMPPYTNEAAHAGYTCRCLCEFCAECVKKEQKPGAAVITWCGGSLRQSTNLNVTTDTAKTIS